MLVSKVKQVYSYELQNKFKKRFEVQEMDYRYREFLDEICDNGLYVRDYSKNKAYLFYMLYLCLNIFLRELFISAKRI